MIALKVSIIVAIAVFNTIGNLLIKKGALQKRIYINAYTISGYCFFIIVLLLSFTLLHYVVFKLFAIIFGINMLTSNIVSIKVFNELWNGYTIFGIFLVFMGVLIFNM